MARRTHNTSFERHELISPDLLPETQTIPEKAIRSRPRHSKKRTGIRILSCLALIVLLVVLVLTAVISRANKNFFVGVKNGFLIRQLTNIFAGTPNALRGEQDDRINFLLAGIGGPGHDGPYLTDTLILASFKPSTKQASMFSIPRDLIVPTASGSYIKVNHIYALNQRHGIERAFEETKKIIGDAFGVTVHYMGVVDFDGFMKLIDAIGGIEVTVDRSFTDRQFPTLRGAVHEVSFKAGAQTMDGLTALRFARSRHGNNSEGSDFARSKRQQKILLATRDKVSSYNTLFNPVKITALYNLLNEYTRTDIEPWEVVKLIQLGRDIRFEDIHSFVLDDTTGYLFGGISAIDGAYILQPRSGSYAELQTLVRNIFGNGAIKKEAPSVVVQNSTTRAQLAQRIATQLQTFDLSILAYGNATERNLPTTIIYDYTSGAMPQTRAFLESAFKTTARTDIPLELARSGVIRAMLGPDADTANARMDFLVILGEDAAERQVTELIQTLQPVSSTTTATSTATGQDQDREEEFLEELEVREQPEE